MSQKNRDYQGRWRNKIIAFRVSPEENLLLNRKVLLSGLTKQDYLIHCMSDQAYVVQGNPYVYRSLRRELRGFIQLFHEVQQLEEMDIDDLELLQYMLEIIINMKNKKEALIKADKEARQ
ncbi:MAG: hypothetical protein UFX20_05530 [Longibaculum muris]|uniref:Mobilization protein MobC n=1 Tax=Longibaculum muris TaxID=1796628 RepID=A0A4R3YLF4_9FIRM|nr:hypothetical protein [Longibaculum muris]KXU51958.1 hypothetical protein HMPREF3037_00583 [Candidatus Stoquefichus sp. KLE1796]MBS5369152.1 hypothetical protein [Coprobacillus cateniformis]MCR1889112.1 hypothetical protein [Longibaculum muris]MED9811538.1 hypothetical protein [Longibaculum muris]TCV93080.1 hypothetical protein EDD60_1241 [Longibaculum muris]